jgi:hypothetical protein
MSDAMPGQPRNGRVVTFYSYIGGTGQTMALANIAWILASNGYRVLAADWDLERRGLHRFYAPFLDDTVDNAQGVIDMVRDYEWHARQATAAEAIEYRGAGNEALRDSYIAQDARVQRFAIPLRNWDFPGGGSLEFLSPGRQNKDYIATLSPHDWDNFYHELNGGAFLDALREDLKTHYDYALIDSGTDTADICTVHLPDVLVDCFTFSNQGIAGATQKAISVHALHGRRIRVLPVPMRVDSSKKERADVGRLYAQRAFEDLPVGLSPAERRDYWANVEVPSVFGDPPGDQESLLSAYERITGYITDGAVTSLPAIAESRRTEARARFHRGLPR